MTPTIEQVRAALNEVGPGMDVERYRALAASLDGMVLVPRATLAHMIGSVESAGMKATAGQYSHLTSESP